MKILQCTFCGKNFEFIQHGKGRPPNVCSDECRKHKHREKFRLNSRRINKKISEEKRNQTHNCVYCGEPYKRKDGGYKYCSKQCKTRANSLNGNHARRLLILGQEYYGPIDFWSVWERDNRQCQHCLKFLSEEDRRSQSPQSPELDHIIPLAKGGVHAEFNCQILCRRCNQKKSDKIYTTDMEKARDLWPQDSGMRIVESPGKAGKVNKPGESGFKGVTRSGKGGRWKYKVQANGEIYQGYGYDSPIAAAIAYNEKVKELGLSARKLNEISDG